MLSQVHRQPQARRSCVGKLCNMVLLAFEADRLDAGSLGVPARRGAIAADGTVPTDKPCWAVCYAERAFPRA